MPHVTYIAHDGKETVLDIAVGTSVMQAAVFNGVDASSPNAAVPACARHVMSTCATTNWRCVPRWSPARIAMLDGTASPRQPNSRLSCQLVMSPKMEGLVVHMPETQI